MDATSKSRDTMRKSRRGRLVTYRTWTFSHGEASKHPVTLLPTTGRPALVLLLNSQDILSNRRFSDL